MRKPIVLFFVFPLIAGCISLASGSYESDKGALTDVVAIVLENAPWRSDSASVINNAAVTDQVSIRKIADAFNHAEGYSPGKCLYPYRVKFVTADTTVILLTNGSIFSYYGDGYQYKLENKNILKDYWNIDTNRRE